MAHAWKACWVKALGGSNPPFSAIFLENPPKILRRVFDFLVPLIGKYRFEKLVMFRLEFLCGDAKLMMFTPSNTPKTQGETNGKRIKSSSEKRVRLSRALARLEIACRAWTLYFAVWNLHSVVEYLGLGATPSKTSIHCPILGQWIFHSKLICDLEWRRKMA